MSSTSRTYRSEFFTADEESDTYTCKVPTCSAYRTDVRYGHNHDQARTPEVTDVRTVVVGGMDATLTTYAPGAHRAASRPAISNEPTAKQVAFLERILKERLGNENGKAFFDLLVEGAREQGAWTKSKVSDMIEAALAIEAPAGATPATDNRRRNRFAGRCVRCGQQVEEQAGYTSKVNGRWVVEHESCESVEVAAQPAQVEAPEGIHFLDGTIYKVQAAKNGSGNRYAKRLEVTDGHGEWIYEGQRGAFRSLSADTLLTREQAEQYGHLYGVCGVCGRTLTDEASIAAGIGPVCAGRFE